MDNKLTNSKKPNWSYWVHLKGALIYQATLLSFDQEPNEEHLEEKWEIQDENCPEVAIPRYNFRDSRIQTRYQIIENHVKYGEPFLIYRMPFGDVTHYEVDLKSFGRWARDIGFDIPDQFPTQITNHADGTDKPENTSTPINLQRSKEIRAIMKVEEIAHAQKVNDSKTLRAMLEKEFKNIGYTVPKVAIEQYAIGIRPDKISRKDRRSRKYQMPI
ncbi:MAG: hypothetical protein RIQ81_1182 [Pseudomonadota bacterium]|jgi:hypothetical protein